MDTKNIISGIILFSAILTNTVNAAALCNANCTLAITFPTGGNIEAVEPLTISFGDGGLIDTAGTVTAYVNGETLTLNADELVTFGDGGSFDIGTVGNIDYSNLVILTSGTIALNAEGGQEQVVIPDGGHLEFRGGATANLGGSISIGGNLSLDGDSALNIIGPGVPSGCEISSTSELTLAATGTGSVLIDNGSNCQTTSNLLINSSLDIGGSLTIVDTENNLVVGSVTAIDVGPITVNSPVNEGGGGVFEIYFLMTFLIIWILKQNRNAKTKISATQVWQSGSIDVRHQAISLYLI